MAKPPKFWFHDHDQFILFSDGCLDLSANLLIGYMVLIKCSITLSSISSQRPVFYFLALLSKSMIYRHTRNMEVTMEHISFTFVPRDMLNLSYQSGFSFIRAAVVSTILERTSGFESSSEKVFEACYSIQLLSFHLDLPLDAIGAVFFISLVLTALISILNFMQVLSRLSVLALPHLEHLCDRQITEC